MFKIPRQSYTAEFKREAVRMVEDAATPRWDMSVRQNTMPVGLPSKNWQHRGYAWYPKNRGKLTIGHYLRCAKPCRMSMHHAYVVN